MNTDIIMYIAAVFAIIRSPTTIVSVFLTVNPGILIVS